jgi:four helix bundle protein
VGDYRKLEVWKLACSVADRMDALYKTLPRRVQEKLGDQLVRAAESIHLNLAEGCGLNSDSQLKRHTRISLGSANELEDGLERLDRRGHVREEFRDLLTDAHILRRRLGAFLKRLNDGQ